MRSIRPRLRPSIGVAVAVGLSVACWTPETARAAEPPAEPEERPAGAGEAPAFPRFVEVTAEAGIRHRHVKPVFDARLEPIMPWVNSISAAACTADFDGDGRLDLFAANSGKGEPNFLYRNDADGTFTDVAEKAGVAHWNDDQGVATDCVWGDVDNDGRPDLFVARWGRSLLLRNDGDGGFTDVTASRFRRADGSAGADWKNVLAAVFLDYDRDGRLDLYLGNYFRDHDLWNLDTTRIMHDHFETSRNGGANLLLRQQADGTFVDVAEEAGVADTGWTVAVGSADVDNDGLPDLYVANDFGPDKLFRNRGDGTFADVSEAAIGVDTKKGMNAEFGDFNNDGWLDIYVTNITTRYALREGNMLWHNHGRGPDGGVTFSDISPETGTFDGGWGWGAKFFDADHDGDLDLLAANGFRSAGPEEYWPVLGPWVRSRKDPSVIENWPEMGDRSFSGYEEMRFFRNEGLSTFTERAREVGLVSDRDNRGIVVFDYDDDGDLDVYLANQGQPPQLFRNQGMPGRHWLMVKLVGDPAHRTTRDAVGARVSAWTEDGRRIRERDGGNGYCGQSDPRLHFGLGESARVARLEVRWPDGGVQVLEDVPADQHLTVRQDPSRYVGPPDAPGRPAAPTGEEDRAPRPEPERL